MRASLIQRLIRPGRKLRYAPTKGFYLSLTASGPHICRPQSRQAGITARNCDLKLCAFNFQFKAASPYSSSACIWCRFWFFCRLFFCFADWGIF